MIVERRVSTQDISWFLDLNEKGQLDLTPPYQRRSVWSPKDRRFFLDTIFRGYPSPTIYLHKQVVSGKTMYHVVDGKQRLDTILRFANNKIAIDKDYGDIRLNGKRWKTISKDEQLAQDFWNYIIPVEQTNIVDSIVVKDIFDRLNRNSRRLVEQELRHAKYDGWLINFVESESESLDWETLGVVTTARAKRMRDVQFLSELLIVLMKGQVSGFDQDEITGYYAKYEDLADLGEPFDEREIRTQFDKGKKYLLRLEDINQPVEKYANDFTNFYSLWAIVCLNLGRLPAEKEFASKYSAFMEEVAKYRDEKYFEKVMKSEVKINNHESLKYYQNSIGASTEPPQRQERHRVLTTVIFG